MTDTATKDDRVRVFFYREDGIKDAHKESLVSLAYATACDYGSAPKAILIRADLHNTTNVDGKYVVDPKGWHGTFAFKGEGQVERKFHVTSHGYTNGKADYTFKEATHAKEKPDNTCRYPRTAGKAAWPAEEFLVEYVHSPVDFST